MIKRNLKNKQVVTFCILGVVVLLYSCVQTGQQSSKTTAQKCLDCHPEMGERLKHGYVHAPVNEERCDQCHLPHGLVGGSYLRQKEPSLCYTCHKDMVPAAEQKSIHSPVAKGKCNSCHTPHNSIYPKLLKEPPKDTCFSCHEQSEFQKKYIHPPLEQGCKTCHDPHKSDNVSLLISAPDAGCRSCHQTDRDTFIKSHHGYPVKSACLQCHTPHSSDKPNLLKKNLHQPVAKGECDSCHQVQQQKITTKGPANQLCLDCHEQPKSGPGTIHKPYLDKQCISCHSVHASDERLLLAKSAETICLDCHDTEPSSAAHAKSDDQGQMDKHIAPLKMKSRHQPVVKGQCLACHNGHKAPRESLLKQNEKELCLTCHEQATYGDTDGSHPPAPDRSCNTCHDPHQSSNYTLLISSQATLCFSCHKKEADEIGRFSLHQPFATGNCTGCHTLHGAKEEKFLKANNKNGDLCATCHKGIQETDKTIHSHAPVAQGECDRCHSPHSADYPFVVKKKPGKLCLECHEDVNTIIHQSKVPHKPAVDENCITCHAAHGSPHDHILKKGQPVLCLSCHNEIAKNWREGVIHKPAVKNCLQCHQAHGSNLQGMLTKKNGQLCVECHETNTAEFLQDHQNIKPGPDSCNSCHDPHGSAEKGLLYPVAHTPFQEGNCSPCHEGRAN